MRFLHWRGELDGATRKQRVNVALFLILLELSAILTDFSHLFIAIPFYVSFLLPPLALAGLLLGPAGGAIVGLVAGIVQYLHATHMPLHFFELLVVTPLTSIVLLPVCGLLWGLLFRWVLHRDATVRSRLHPLLISSLAVSLIYTVAYASPVVFTDPEKPIAALSGTTFNDLLSTSSYTAAQIAGTSIVQVLINALYVAIVCIVMHLAVRRLLVFTKEVGLRTAFRIFFICVFFITYLFTITLSFVSVSRREMREADAAMHSDADYLYTQAEYLYRRSDAFSSLYQAIIEMAQRYELPSDVKDELREKTKILTDARGKILSGYTLENEGTVMLIDNTVNEIIESDDSRIPLDADASKTLGPDIITAIESSIDTGEVKRILYHNILTSPGYTGGYSHGTQLGLLIARRTEYFTIVLIEPSSMVFRDRWEIIGREVAISVILLASTLGIIALLTDAMVTRRIKKTNEALARITAGDLEARATVEGARELKSLSTDINTTVDTLNRWIKEAETRMDSELAAARAIQESSLPREFPPFPGQTSFDIYASMHAAREVGGDFYDFYLVEGEGTNGGDLLVFLIADVSGKGVPASLFMMKTKTLIRESIMRHAEEGGDAIFETVNRELAADNDAFMFVTLWAAMLDCNTGNLYYINAGHNPPLLCHDGEWVSLRDRSGIPLGMRPNITYEQFSCELKPGDRLVTYTDGVTEARNDDRELFGDERLMETVEQCDATEPRELVDTVNAAVSEFAGSAPQADDITVLALTYHG